MNEALQRFYLGEGTDLKGRTFDELISWSDDQLEGCHDQIQNLFPLPEPSNFNANAPLLTQDDILVFRDDHRYQAQARRVLARFRAFYGLDEAPGFRPWVASGMGHNLLRVTRIIRFLVLIGLYEDAYKFWKNCYAIATIHPVTQRTLDFWDAALHSTGPFAG